VVSKGDKGTGDVEAGRWRGTASTATDTERAALGLPCGAQGSMNFILTGSMAALHSILNSCKGAPHPPHSGIEVEIKNNLKAREYHDTATAWTRSHISIPGIEQADRLAAFTSILGDIQGATQVATKGGVRPIPKATRAPRRSRQGFGKRRTDWRRHALSSYTWMRTNRGTQKSWLNHIGKAADASCPCGHPSQDGNHIDFDCTRLDRSRKDLLGGVFLFLF